MKKILLLMALFATMLMGASCDKKNEVDDPNYEDLEMTLSRNLLQIMVGDKATLQPQWTREIDDNEVSYTWASSNEKVATVSKNGQVEGIALGEATISVRTMYREDEYMAKCKVEVMTNKAVITYQGEVQDASAKLTVEETSTLQLGAKLAIDKEAVKSVSWTTANAKVAEVNDAGKVTGVAPGSTIIEATVISENDIKYTASIQVTVKGLLRLRINGELPGTTPYELGWGETAVISIPDGYSGKWTMTGDTSIVKVAETKNSFTVKATAGVFTSGGVTVTVQSDGKSMACKLINVPAKMEMSVAKNEMPFYSTQSVYCNYEKKFGLKCDWKVSTSGVLSVGEMDSYNYRTVRATNFAPSGVQLTCSYSRGGKLIATSDPVTIIVPYPSVTAAVSAVPAVGEEVKLWYRTDLSSDEANSKLNELNLAKWTASSSSAKIRTASGETYCTFTKRGYITVTVTLGTSTDSKTVNVLPGFLVSSTDYKYMLPSNVYYHKGNKSYGAYQFYEFWACAGDANSKISDDTYSGEIDLLAHGAMPNDKTSPLLTTTTETKYSGFKGQYSSKYINLTSSNLHTTMSLPEVVTMFTYSEMDYIINKRPNAAKKYSVCRIDMGSSVKTNRYRNGLLLIPEFYDWPSVADSTSFKPGAHSWSDATYMVNEMRDLVNNGAVFLPAGGTRKETSMAVSFNSGGYYWLTGEEWENTFQSKYRGSILHFDEKEVKVYKGTDEFNNYANRGMLIRLGFSY